MVRTIAIGGFMGVGKTTAGRGLAERLGVGFLDLDTAIERAACRTVSEIFSIEGEPAFRQHETQALRCALQGEPKVLALGGGTLHHGTNCIEVRTHADIVCLGMPFHEIQVRLGTTDMGRPLWSARKTLYAERIDMYRRAGTYIDVSGLTPESVLDRIEEAVSCA
jgi:shikimate kinase